MRVIYTYEGERDPEFESSMTAQVGERGGVRQVKAEPTGKGYVQVTLETTLDSTDRNLVDRLRAHERIIDVIEGDKRMY